MTGYSDDQQKMRRTALKTALDHLEKTAEWHRAALDAVGSEVLAVAKRSPPPNATSLPELHFKREGLSEWRARLGSAAERLPGIREKLAVLTSGIARLGHFDDITDPAPIQRGWSQRVKAFEQEIGNFGKTIAALDEALHKEIYDAQMAVLAAQKVIGEERRKDMFSRWGIGKN